VIEICRFRKSPKEVLIVCIGGICGTDVGVVDGHVSATYPVTLGHEYSGVVAKVGSTKVMPHLREGDPVVSGGGYGCGECELCRQGMDLYCTNRRSLGRNFDGCMAEYIKVDYRSVSKLPPAVSLDEAQNIVNIGCAVRAVRKLDLAKIKTAAVIGPGNAGLMILQLLKMGGVGKVVMAGTRDFRLEMARSFGADEAVNIRREDLGKKIAGWFLGVDAVSSPPARPAGSRAPSTSSGPTGRSWCSASHRQMKEFDLVLYQRSRSSTAPRARQEPSRGHPLAGGEKPRILPMITHRFPLEETAKAFKVFSDKIADALRIVIDVRP
jgi:threonine dehydrogenase-like Zn-dependent dehydrogenase